MQQANYSEKVIEQTKAALELIKRAEPLIVYKNLVPVSEERISRHEAKAGRVFPPDFRYWLKHVGSGVIIVGSTEIEIPCPEEIEIGGRTIGSEDPADCWKRVYLGYPGSPATPVLDTTVTDEHGCCPVSMTHEYSNHIDEVESSSWPTYVIRRIIETAEMLTEKANEAPRQNNISWFDDYDPMEHKLDAPQIEAARQLANFSLAGFEPEMEDAQKRTENHGQSRLADGDPVPTPKLGLADEDIEPGTLEEALKLLEEYTTSGRADCSAEVCYFIEEKTTPRDKPELQNLMYHTRRSIRRSATAAHRRLNPEEAEKNASRYQHWIQCAESWIAYYKDEANARRCLAQAEALIEDPDDWRSVGACWHEKLHNKAEALRCLEQYEAGLANDPGTDIYDWSMCADRWQEFGEEKRANAVLKRAHHKLMEDLASGANPAAEHLIKLADIWIDEQSPEKVLQSLEGAEIQARLEAASTEDPAIYPMLCCAKKWSLLEENDRASTLLTDAERHANSRKDWLACVEHWLTALEDETQARRCAAAGTKAFPEMAEEFNQLIAEHLELQEKWARLAEQIESRQSPESADS